MKLAISGKGGVGKSTVSAALAMLLARRGQFVLAVDADPDANLASALGMPSAEQQAIVPISKQDGLIRERTGAEPGKSGQVFKLNPDCSDIAERFAVQCSGVSLLVLGAVDHAASGCACPESILLRGLVTDLVLYKDQMLIIDFEAGVEHLGRATARGVDTMLVVVEPGQRSVDCARRVAQMAGELGIAQTVAVANKVTSPEDQEFIESALGDIPLLGSIPYEQEIRAADRDGQSVLDNVSPKIVDYFEAILIAIEERIR